MVVLALAFEGTMVETEEGEVAGIGNGNGDGLLGLPSTLSAILDSGSNSKTTTFGCCEVGRRACGGSSA